MYLCQASGISIINLLSVLYHIVDGIVNLIFFVIVTDRPVHQLGLPILPCLPSSPNDNDNNNHDRNNNNIDNHNPAMPPIVTFWLKGEMCGRGWIARQVELPQT